MAYNKKAHLTDNIEAIKTAFLLENEQREAVPAEREILSRYSGFGGLKCILNPARTLEDASRWAKSEMELFPLVAELHRIIRELASDGMAVGIGMGFCSRIYAVRFAIEQAGEKAKDAVMASDAFFPFPDGIEAAAAAGIPAVMQPGGSVHDADVIEAAKKLSVSMFLSAHRTFRH